jgi:hypothetical protein
MRKRVTLFLAALAVAPVASADGAKLDVLKKEAAAEIDRLKDMSQQMVDQVFSFGELGFQEFETSKYLAGVLRKNGFTVKEGVAGMPTAWVATWGQGKPVIALGSDIDCIPKASQKPGVGYHDPIIENAPGHGEGHNSGVPLNITAAIVVKRTQLGRAAQHHGGDRGEADHGAREDPRHADAVAGRGRGTRRRQGLVRARGPVQERRRYAVHPRVQRLQDELGRTGRDRSGVG